jgi:predicted ATPase
MIDSVVIEGYKSIRSQEVKLQSMNILLGGNGVGKSNFLSVFDFFRKIVQSRDYEYAHAPEASRLLYMGRKVTDKIRLSFMYSDSWLNSMTIDLKDVDNRLRVRGLDIDENEKAISDSTKGKDYNIERLRKLVDQYWIHHFQDTGAKSSYRTSSLVDDNRFLRADGSNLASFLYRIRVKEPHLFRKIEDYIHEVTPSFGCFDLRPDAIDENNIRLLWHPDGGDVLFDEYQLSDGSLRMMSLVTLLLQSQLPELIIIDEPEIGLHPTAISILADLLKTAAEKTQVIISTQSIDLINYFTPEDIIVADFKNAQSLFKRLSTNELHQWIDEYTLGEMWEKNLFGGQPY